MDFDILSKLIPNVLTMITQLAATGVIYLLYKKHLHQPVLDYLAARRALIADELASAEKMRNEAEAIKVQGEAEYADLYKEIAILKEKLTEDAKREHERLLVAAKEEITVLKEQSEKALRLEREQMHEELYANLLEVAATINHKVLEEVKYDEDDMLAALQKEIDQNDYQH